MAVDKLVDSTQLDSDLTSVANAIRAKSGGSSQLAFPAGFVSEIGNISGGGGGLTKINEINISQDVRSVGIPVTSDWLNYDFFVIDFAFTFSGNDYLYFDKTDLNTGGTMYTSSRANYFYYGVGTKGTSSGTQVALYPVKNQLPMNVGETMYCFMYTSSKTIKSGSKVTIYGGTIS